ncbi:MAG TPA: TonB-dependent receptor, partial [bacterium]|nr:TonB-dependent receptor [bacterium]
HETFALAPNISLLFDLQLTRKQYRFQNEKYLNHEFEIPYLFINPSAGVNVNFTDRFNGYINLSRTTREPRLKNYYDAAEASQPAAWGTVDPKFGTNADGSYDYSNPLVKPETLYDLELGIGYRTSSLQWNANIYYMDFRNEIVKNGQLDRFGQPVTGNAKRTRHYGLELSGTWQMFPSLQVSGNTSLSRNKFVEFTSFGWGSQQTLDGNTIAGFPGTMANVRTRYTRGPFFLVLEGQYVGKQYTTNFEDDGPAVDAYTVWNSRIGYRIPLNGTTLRTTFTINNLFDALYATHGEGDDFFPAAPRRYFFSLQYEI